MILPLQYINERVLFHDAKDSRKDFDTRYWQNGDFKGFVAGFNYGMRIGGNRITLYPQHKRKATFDQRDRERVVGFSKTSGARMSRYLRESTSVYKTFVTLTYPSDSYGAYDGRRCKRDLATFIKRLKRVCAVPETFSCFWFMEFTDKGTVHFHLFTTEKFIEYQWLAKSWADICKIGGKHQKAGTSVEKIRSGRYGCMNYAKKYAKKQTQKVVPPTFVNPGRFWGIAGVKTVAAATVEIGDEIRHVMGSKRSFIREIEELIRKENESGAVFGKEIMIRDEHGEEKPTGVVFWDLNRPVGVRKLRKLMERYGSEYSGEYNGKGFVNTEARRYRNAKKVLQQAE